MLCVPTCSVALSYLEVPAADCPFLMGCGGNTVFALCNGESYVACGCTNPGFGWTPARGLEAGLAEGSSTCDCDAAGVCDASE